MSHPQISSVSEFPYYLKPNLTPMHNVQNYVYVYFNLYIIRQQTEIQKILGQIVAIIHQIYSVRNFPRC
jgi:hypothetical protein